MVRIAQVGHREIISQRFSKPLANAAPRARAKKGAGLDTVILDELHALAASKRGDLLALDLAQAAHPIA